MRFDYIAIMLVVLAVMISIYVGTFTHSIDSLFPVVLLLSGLALSRFFTRRTEIGETPNLFYYTMIGFASTMLLAIFVPKIFVQSLEYGGLITILMAVSEEVFFRGFLMMFIYKMTENMITANIIQSVIWAVYHTAVYGSSPAIMLWIMLTGLIYGWIDFKTMSITPSLISHTLVNIIASGVIAP